MMRALTAAALPLVILIGTIALAGGPNGPGYVTPTVTVPLYGVGMAPQQPAEGSSVEDRLTRMEAKLDKLLKLIEDELTPVDPPAADPKATPGQPSAALISGATKCAGCHSIDKAKTKGADFVLFTAAGIFAPLSDRQVQQVRKRLTTTDPSFQMPPPGTGASLTDPERAALVAVFTDPPIKKESVP